MCNGYSCSSSVLIGHRNRTGGFVRGKDNRKRCVLALSDVMRRMK